MFIIQQAFIDRLNASLEKVDLLSENALELQSDIGKWPSNMKELLNQ